MVTVVVFGFRFVALIWIFLMKMVRLAVALGIVIYLYPLEYQLVRWWIERP
jgi:hypothetical protein